MHTIKNERGFTLVEMAIVLIVSGLLFSMIMFAYKTYTMNGTRDATKEAIDLTQQATNQYRLIYAEYPCPADPALPPTHARYGFADCAAATRLIGRDAINDLDNDPLTDGDIVLKGTVPFRTLLDPNEDGNEGDKVFPIFVAKHAFDSWGNKLTYAVTASLTKADLDGDGNRDFTYDKENGAIDIVDEGLYLDPDPIKNREDASILSAWGTAHFVVISHGPNGVGAYNREGTIGTACNLGLTAMEEEEKDLAFPLGSAPDETENCENVDGRDATFIAGIKNESKSFYYDDIIKFSTHTSGSLWARTDKLIDDNGTPGDDSDDVTINQYANTNDGNVGVGISDPSEKLDVDGDIQAFGIHANQYCDSEGKNCMLPDAIGGELEDMTCPNGQVIVSIYENKVQCESPFTAASFGDCEDPDIGGPGYALRGISTSGPICAELAPEEE